MVTRPPPAHPDGPRAGRALLRRDGHAGPGPLVVPGPAGARGRPAGGRGRARGHRDRRRLRHRRQPRRPRRPRGRPVVGVELSQYAVRHAPRAPGGGVRVGVARAEHLPFPAGCADLVTSMDVIEHLDDDAALADYRRVVRPGGLVLLTVPAYQWLWSDHDTWAAHRRRYSRPTLVAAVDRAGLRRAAGHLLQLVPGAAGRGAAPDPGPPAGQGRAGRGGGGQPGGRPGDERARGSRAALGPAPGRAVRAVDRLPVRATLNLDFRSRVPCPP